MEYLKQALGVDVAQKELVATLGRMSTDLSIELYAHKVFRNTEAGFAALAAWARKLAGTEVWFVMEATGVYHQKFAHYLDKLGHSVSVVLPNKISNYMRTLENKTVTDRTCSEAITRFGLERRLDPWKRPKAVYATLQQLTRERDQIVAERSVVKNQLHAESSGAEPNARSIGRLEARIRFLNGQEAEIRGDIDECLEKDAGALAEVGNICTIPGVGRLTAVTILAETNGFELVRNKKQLASYAGLDVREKSSGTSVKGRPRISKKGNRSLRKAMHLPSLSAVKWDEGYRAVYARLVARHGIKMKALVAIQRKLLELAFVLHKSKRAYEKGYTGDNGQKNRACAQTATTPYPS